MRADVRSLMIRSDLMVMGGLSQIEGQGAYSVIRTPSEPDYWCGNIIVVHHEAVDPVAEIVPFQQVFPDARHVRVIWDVPDMDPGLVRDALDPLGFEVSPVETLTLENGMRDVALPKGIASRQLLSDQDWADLDAFHTQSALAEGRDMAVHGPYQTRRNAARRAQSAAGFAAWIGAYDGDLMVASLGIYVGSGLARYQTVETAEAYRGRGNCSGLLRVAYDWAMTQDADAQVVIVADAGGDGGRLYRRMGFGLAEHVVEAHRDGY